MKPKFTVNQKGRALGTQCSSRKSAQKPLRVELHGIVHKNRPEESVVTAGTQRKE
jgi:hypothetical protein